MKRRDEDRIFKIAVFSSNKRILQKMLDHDNDGEYLKDQSMR